MFKYIRGGLAVLLHYNNKNIVLFSTLSFNLIKYHSTAGLLFGWFFFAVVRLMPVAVQVAFFFIVSNELLVNP